MQKQWLPVRLGLCALGLLALLSACGKTEVGLSKTAADYETMSYAEFKEQTGNEAEFYHEIRYIGAPYWQRTASRSGSRGLFPLCWTGSRKK